MIKACVIGHPVAQSKSPAIHGHWFAQAGIDGRYDRRDVAPGELAAALEGLRAEGYAGCNVTVPHKEAVIAHCDTLTPTAKKIGAVNTLVFKEDGQIHGDNTDAFGFIENIRESAPEYDFAAAPALVLGGGGAARAAVRALLDAGCPEIRLTNRTIDKAVEIAKADPARIKVVVWESREGYLRNCGLLANTTTLGMAGQPGLELRLGHLPDSAVVCDIVYAPLMTNLLHAAQAQGNRVVTGIGMLLHQARPAFRAWTGVDPQVDADLRALVLGGSEGA